MQGKSVLNVMACVVATCALVSLLWFAVGCFIAFTSGSGALGPVFGGTGRLWFSGLDYLKDAQMVAVGHIAPNIPESAYAVFQLRFAIITGAHALFSLADLHVAVDGHGDAPIALLVWAPGGWLARLDALDFAGGSVVHVNASVADLKRLAHQKAAEGGHDDLGLLG